MINLNEKNLKKIIFTSIDLRKSANSSTTDIQVSSNRGASCVEPVGIGWGELVEDTSLNQVVPGGDLEFTVP